MSRLLPVTYKGVAYRSLVDLCRSLGRESETNFIRNRIKKMGWPLNEAIQVPKALPRTGKGSVYLVTRISNGTQYVGITTVDPLERWYGHVSCAKYRNSPLARAILEDGQDGFTITVLESGLSTAELGDREKHWIISIGTRVPNGLNANRGGSLGGRRGTGRNARAQEIAKRDGVNVNTARRWVNEGRAGGEARRYEAHGSTHHPLFKRWHGMRSKAGVCEEWQNFHAWLAWFEPRIDQGKVGRIDFTKPWSPTNIRVR